MAGLLGQRENKTASRIKPREEDLFTRTLVVAGEQALAAPEIGGQLVQFAGTANTPEDGVGMALAILLGNMRSAVVEQGKGLPMEVVFIPGGTADILAESLAEDVGIPQEEVPTVAKAAVQVAQQMLLQMDEATQSAMQQQQGGDQGAPQPGMESGVPAGHPQGMGQPAPSAHPQGLLGGM